jgi:putative endonuclease
MNIARNNYWRSRKGLHFEELALAHLQEQGLRLLQRNYRCNMGEIDLLMLHQEVLVFIEVRFRGSASHGGALATITHGKQQKLLRTARFFLLCHQEHQHRICRFDVMGVQPGPAAAPQFAWVQNAFC